MIERENSPGATLLPPHTFSQGGGGSGRLMQKVKRIKTHTVDNYNDCDESYYNNPH